jgi:vacuole morphology and inheritance protein 14
MNTSLSSQQTIPFDERASKATASLAVQLDSDDEIIHTPSTNLSATVGAKSRQHASKTATGQRQPQNSRLTATSNSNTSKSYAVTTPSATSNTSIGIANHQQPPPPPPLRSSQTTSTSQTATTNTLHQPHGAPATGPSSYSSAQKSHHYQQQQYSFQHSQQPPTGYMNQVAALPNTGGAPQSDHTSSPLPPIVLRSLGDRSNEKRKNAALEIEALIKLLTESNNFGTINAIITVLSKDFCTSMNSNYRKGGLVGLAATAIGLHTATNTFLQILLPPVLHCFDDPESRVRYYACESIYNMAKVTRQGILLYFNPIFDGLSKLFADVDVDVKNGANLLDRLIKDIVTEADSDMFQVDQFLPVMQNYIRRTNPYIRQLIVGWISLLDSLPDLSLLDYLPDFLDGLLNMLSDSNREIRQAADAALSEFLRELSGSEVLEFGPIISILVLQCQSKERLIRLTAITWLAELSHHPLSGGDAMLPFLPDVLSAILYCICDQEKEIRLVAERTNDDLLQLVRDTNGEFELRPLLETLTNELLEKEDVPTKMASLQWLNMLKEKRMQDMHTYTVNLLPVLLRTLSDPSDAVVLLDLQILSRISLTAPNDATTSMVENATNISDLNPLFVDKEEKHRDSPTLISEPREAQFQLVLNAILNLFAQDRQLLETRGSLIIRKLCVLLNARAVYIRMAETLSSYESKNNSSDHPDTAAETIQFISTMVQTLNLILLTASELHDLRTTLANSFENGRNFVCEAAHDGDGDGKVFQIIFQCWCHNPIATFSLCLLAKAYDLSFELVKRFSEMQDVTVGFLMQVDKLVYLLESPIFLHLRLQLLNVESPNHAQLLKSLYGILMCLPQGEAFRLLNDRLTTVCNLRDNLGYSTFPLGMIDAEHDSVDGSHKPNQKVIEQMLERYDKVRERHCQIEDSVAQKISSSIPVAEEIRFTTSNADGTTTIANMPSLKNSSMTQYGVDRNQKHYSSSEPQQLLIHTANKSSITTETSLSRYPAPSFTNEQLG